MTTFIWLPSFIHSTFTEQSLFDRLRAYTLPPLFKSIQIWHSLQFHSQKLFSEVFPNSPSRTGCFRTSTFSSTNTGFLQTPRLPGPQQVATKCLRKIRKCRRWGTSPRSLTPHGGRFGPSHPRGLSIPKRFSVSRQPNKNQSWRSGQTYSSHHLPCASRGLRTY